MIGLDVAKILPLARKSGCAMCSLSMAPSISSAMRRKSSERTISRDGRLDHTPSASKIISKASGRVSDPVMAELHAIIEANIQTGQQRISTTKRVLGDFRAAIILCAGALAAGCAGSGPSPPPSSAKALTESPPRCSGALGMEAVPISRPLRKKLALPDGVKGAVVAEVLPGGPAAAAGIRADDVVEEIGSARITNDCEFIEAAYSRACEPVRVVLRRGAASVETKLVPVDQDAFFERSCRDGINTGCFRQAWTLWSRNEGSDRDRALDLYRAACRAGSAEACAHEGLHRMNTADRDNDAIAVLERACELGSGAGCAHLAFLYATGSGKLVKRDDRRATRLYVRACDLGDAKGCYNVGLMADDGRGGARNISRAVAKYDEACEMGSSSACTNLGFHFENGRGVKKDKVQAVALYRRGCDGTSCQPSNLNGCVNLGRAYRDGMGIEKNATQAASIFQEACHRKTHPGDVDAEENRSRACSLLGALYLAGDGVEKNLTKGRELSELGCGRGDSFGCFNAAAVFASGTGVEADAVKAASFLDKACQGGDAEGCHDLGVAY
jgi:TPR repeat protein